MLADVGAAIVAFVATNVDEIVLLAVLFGSGLKARAVVAGPDRHRTADSLVVEWLCPGTSRGRRALPPPQ
jgi:hypothetical protein